MPAVFTAPRFMSAESIDHAWPPNAIVTFGLVVHAENDVKGNNVQ